MSEVPCIDEAKIHTFNKEQWDIELICHENDSKQLSEKYNFSMNAFYQLIRADPAFIEYLNQQENELELNRRRFLMITDEEEQPIAGLRVFDGSKVSKGQEVEKELAGKPWKTFHMPMERMFFLKKIPSEQFTVIVPERAFDDDSYGIFELGRTFILPNVKTNIRKLVRQIFFKYIMELANSQLNRFPADRISIYMHPFSNIQSKLFSKNYFMEPVTSYTDGTNYHRIKGDKVLLLEKQGLLNAIHRWNRIRD